MRDFDFHPPEETIRTFVVPDDAIVLNDETTCISQTRQPDAFADDGRELVLRHHAFGNEWFKLNAAFDLDGKLIQPGPPETAFAVNCDIATPMVRLGSDISAVDLFLDVLIKTDGSYRVADRDEFDQAAHPAVATAPPVSSSVEQTALDLVPSVAPRTRPSW